MTAEIESADAKAPRHHWGAAYTVLPNDSHNGCELTQRICEICGLVKITVHPPEGFPYRQWRGKGGMLATLEHTPPCGEHRL